MDQSASLLGDYSLTRSRFSGLDQVFEKLRTDPSSLIIWQQRGRINQALLELIQKEPSPCFLLPAVLDFIERVEGESLIPSYPFSSFELWLNQFSGLSREEQLKVRGKIAGKEIDRSDYEVLFPIGMNRSYEGTHFVTAHKSPDLDTTVASFWGWLDAFAARVTDGVHIWNLPGGPPGSQMEIDILFREAIGPSVFSHLAKTRTSLNLTGRDLLTQKGLSRHQLTDSLEAVNHQRDLNAIVLVDPDGFYEGDWRTMDVEGVHQVLILLSSCLRWFENQLHLRLISLFAQKEISKNHVSPFLEALFSLPLKESEPVLGFTPKQAEQLDGFLRQILKIENGFDCDFQRLGQALTKRGLGSLLSRKELLEMFETATLFDSEDRLVDKRPELFEWLEKVVRQLHESIYHIRRRLEQFDVAMSVKNQVIGLQPHVVTIRSDVEEILHKMGSYPSLTVVESDKGRFYPMGVIHASALRKSCLGTVTLRDFCNRDEMGIPSYLEVISVIDHHKSSLQTITPPMAFIYDVQSSNSIVAEKAFVINDRYSTRGQSSEQIDQILQELKESSSDLRLRQRLLQRKVAAMRDGFIDSKREFLEYLHFLYAILDDTDLLSKVTGFDVEIVAELLNRLKSLSVKKEVEVIHFDDIPRGPSFASKAAVKLLQNAELHSLYRKIYAYREGEVEKNIQKAAEGQPSNFFADTKEQNGCCRIGQTKMFAKNIQMFEEKASLLRRFWAEKAIEISRQKEEIDLHLHMISTISSADEVFKGSVEMHSHRDELWIWIGSKESGIEHLKQFLSAFQSSPGLQNGSLDVEFMGERALELSEVFRESFLEIPHHIGDVQFPVSLSILRFTPGALNSRKAMVSPFLPHLPSN